VSYETNFPHGKKKTSGQRLLAGIVLASPINKNEFVVAQPTCRQARKSYLIWRPASLSDLVAF